MMLRNLLNLFRRSKVKNVFSTGEGTKISGTLHLGHSNSKIEIGSNCFVEGILTTYTSGSKIIIGNNVFIGQNSIIGSASKVEIGDHVLISFDCIIQDSDTHHLDSKKRKNDTVDWMHGKKNWEGIPALPIRIEKDAWIGARSIILKGVVIGEGSVVGAGSCVSKDVLPFTVVAGNPAKFIKNIEH